MTINANERALWVAIAVEYVKANLSQSRQSTVESAAKWADAMVIEMRNREQV